MKAAINALTLDLATRLNVDLGVARQFATTFFEDNADLFSAPAPGGPVRLTESLGARVAAALDAAVENPERARVLQVPARGNDGLTDKQRAAMSTVGLCPNCQEPNNDHLPGCARASGEVPNAITKTQLPPTG